MSRILENAKRLVTTPGMLRAYWNWVFAHTFSGKRPALACTSDTQICSWLNFSEYWSVHRGISQAEKCLMIRCLNSTSFGKTVAIDVGANLGLFTITLAGLGYSEVHAFEPVPQTFARLKANVANNHLLETVQLNCIAIGSEEGFAEFQIFEESSAINGIVGPSAYQPTPASTQRVPVTTLDRYCSENQISKIDFLKIDAEGMDPLVMIGMQSLLNNRCVSAILLEMCPLSLSRVNFTVSQFYELIINSGYLPYSLLENGSPGQVVGPEDLQAINWEKVLWQNFVVLPTAD